MKFNSDSIKLVLLLSLIFTLSACQYSFQPSSHQDFSVEIATKKISIANFNLETVQSLHFQAFSDDTKLDKNMVDEFSVFYFHRKDSAKDKQTLVVFPHYFEQAHWISHDLTVRKTYYRFLPNSESTYSPNIIAFDLPAEDSEFYLLINTKTSKKVKFLLENTDKVRNYDRKLNTTFVAVYAVILTLIFINFVFYVFIRKSAYLYYSLYVLFSLVSIFFQEGFITYFPAFAKPVLGIYSTIFWIRLPGIFFDLFLLKFLDLKQRSAFDFRLVRFFLFIDISFIALSVIFYIFNITWVYSLLSMLLNISAFFSIVVFFYIPIKYTLLKVPMAKYLLIGWLFYYGALIARIIYSLKIEPLNFWLPRAFEFGLMIDALALSFGLADKTLRLMRQRDMAQQKVDSMDRQLFQNALVKSFQLKAYKTIENYFGNQRKLDFIINNYFTSSLYQVINAKHVYYIFELNGKLSLYKLSKDTLPFDFKQMQQKNAKLIKKAYQQNKIGKEIINLGKKDELTVFIVPIVNSKYKNLCFFLYSEDYEDMNEKIIKDSLPFLNNMTHTLIEVNHFKNTSNEAKFDALTKVLNRKTTLDILTNLYRKKKLETAEISLAFIDVDDFKYVNDNFGHAVGDDCLFFLCKSLRSIFREKCYIGRFGGDEFIIVFDGLSAEDISLYFQALYNYFKTNKIHDFTIKISVGIACLKQNPHLTTTKKLMIAADKAVYQAKNTGKNQFKFYQTLQSLASS